MKRLVSLIVCVLLVSGAYATTWDLASSQSATNPFGADNAFSLHQASDGQLLVLTDSVFWAPWFGPGWGIVGQQFPSTLALDDHGAHGEAANELMVQPFGGLVARWTSPINGTVQVDAHEGQGGWNQTAQSGYKYYVNGVLEASAYVPWPVGSYLWPGYINTLTDTVAVSIGDTIDFVIVLDGPLGDGGASNPSAPVALRMTITEVIPEPATLALLGLGGLSLIRRRK